MRDFFLDPIIFFEMEHDDLSSRKKLFCVLGQDSSVISIPKNLKKITDMRDFFLYPMVFFKMEHRDLSTQKKIFCVFG